MGWERVGERFQSFTTSDCTGGEGAENLNSQNKGSRMLKLQKIKIMLLEICQASVWQIDV